VKEAIMRSEFGGALKQGYVLGFTDDHGFGVYAMRTYRVGEIVMGAGNAAKAARRRSAPRQLAAGHGDLLSRVCHSLEPNCGIRVSATGAHDLVACHEIVPGAELTFDYSPWGASAERETPSS
jgi:hypothetical protein